MRGAAAIGLLPVTKYAAGCGDGSGGADGVVENPDYSYEGDPGPDGMFAHGVASGDPLSDAVILWTRVSPPEDGEIEVYFEMSPDASFEERIAAGYQKTSDEHDYTIKVDVTRLQPGTTYYYRFWYLGRESAIGRTRTAPAGGVDRLRLAVMSCSNYAYGYFLGYRHAAQRADIDAVLHLGDYIYEYGNGEYGGFRDLQPDHEILSLSDYRTRYAYYRSDPDLQAIHQQHPFIAVWDDHELTNDAWKGGAQNHDGSEGDFEERKAIAARVYSEWMPIRDQPDGRIFRAQPYGDLLDIIMLDTRIWGRDEQSPDADDHTDESRTLLGDDQEMWLAEQLQASKATWCLIGQQIVVGQLQLGGATLNPDAWDGYDAARRRFLSSIVDSGRDNVVVVTGDIHASAASDLAADAFDADSYDPDTGDGAVAVEFVAPGITSPFPPQFASLVQNVVETSPHMKWANSENRGYMVLDVTPERVQADWFLYPDPEQEDGEASFDTAFEVRSGTPHIIEVDGPVSDRSGAPDLAPTE